MSRHVHTALNFAVGFVVAYLVASRVGEGDGALKPALLSGAVTALVAWTTYERPSVLEDGDDAAAGSDADAA